MEYWSTGVLKYWSVGFFVFSIHPLFHPSITPIRAKTHLLGEAHYLFLRYSKNLLYGGNPIEHLQGTILTKSYHPLVNSLFLYGIGIRGL